MTKADGLRALIEAIETFPGGEKAGAELDQAIANALRRLHLRWASTTTGYYTVPPFTTSVDAAMALVEHHLPGWGYCLFWNNCQGFLATVRDDRNSYEGSTCEQFEAMGETAPMALVAAMLKGIVFALREPEPQ